MARLLAVDDEPNVLYTLEKCLRSEEIEVLTASNGKEAIRRAQEWRPDVVIIDVCLPDMSGLEAYDQIRRVDPLIPVIIITAFARTEVAIEATKRGAFEYLLKPVDYHQLQDIVDRALDVSRLNRVPAVVDEEEVNTSPADLIVGRSPAMQEVYKLVGRVAQQDVAVLILGESGTGKELVARAIYHYSHRVNAPFLAINCAAIPEALLESELFGHEKGAFTGANERRIGKFERVNGGTIFLDEIGDMSASTQAKVLRLLQEQKFERVGGNQTVETNVRIIAATNRGLAQLVSEGKFRQDLLFRINGFTIALPPLRERAGDVRLLVDHFIRRFNRELNKNIRGVTPEAMNQLESYPWPGNIRELQSSLRFAMLHAKGDMLSQDCFSLTSSLDHLYGGAASAPRANGAMNETVNVGEMVRDLLRGAEGDIYRRVINSIDDIVISVVLNYTRGNQVHAAALLGISRTTLRAKLRSLSRAMEATGARERFE